MGQAVCEAVEGAEDLTLTANADPTLGVELADVLDEADVVVDFTIPDVALADLRAVWPPASTSSSERPASTSTPPAKRPTADAGANCFVAPNFAIGAVLLMDAAQPIAPHMPETEIVELHHDRKLDAPSGTATRTAELIHAAGGHVHEPIHSIHLPGLVAHQEVIFGGAGQTLSLRHDSIDRHSFMPGVLLAVRKVPTLPDPFTSAWRSYSKRLKRIPCFGDGNPRCDHRDGDPVRRDGRGRRGRRAAVGRAPARARLARPGGGRLDGRVPDPDRRGDDRAPRSGRDEVGDEAP